MSAQTAAFGATLGRYRWTICSLIFMATTINYLDRAVISLLKPYIAASLGWSAIEEVQHYANIEIAFKIAYTFGMLLAGRFVDKVGTKWGYAIATGLWSLAAVGHGFVSSTFGFIIARTGLGVTEAGNFPAAIKATAEWFPVKERAFATGIFNSGANVGAIIAPLSVPFIAEHYGWQMAFILTGAVGFIWLLLWAKFYEHPDKHPSLSEAERSYITADQQQPAAKAQSTDSGLRWYQLLRHRQTWAFAIGKLLTDPIWWFYLFWLPDFLKKQYQLSNTEIALPTALVYIIASFGSIFGGWLPLKLVNRNWSNFAARRTSMLIYALAVLPIVAVQWLGQLNMWLAVLIISLAASAHQAWSANIFTTVSDLFPSKATASVVGLGGMFGGLGGILLSALVQKQLFVHYESIGQIQTGYFIMFLICGAAYLLAWFIMKLLVPRHQPVEL